VDDGPQPTIKSFATDAEEQTSVVARIKALVAEGVAPGEIAILVRLNAQTVGFEEALARDGIPYQLRGKRFFERREIKTAIRALERVSPDASGEELIADVRRVWASQLGFDPDETPDGREARERHATLSTLLAIVSELVQSDGGRDRDAVTTELETRAVRELSNDSGGVELLTFHRAKGLEWDAVFLPALEEGLLPVSHAGDDAESLAEERRLLYVGITRARRHLALSWAQQRLSSSGKLQRRTMSRFLGALGASSPAPVARPGRDRTRAEPGTARARLGADDALLFDSLRAWRLEQSREDKVSPFIVAYDTVLAEIAERRPRSEAELLAIPGIGPGKVEKYGEDILRIVGAE
jgi:DNA helicase-2/ATP-dependent DNA helicase PcrA